MLIPIGVRRKDCIISQYFHSFWHQVLALQTELICCVPAQNALKLMCSKELKVNPFTFKL